MLYEDRTRPIPKDIDKKGPDLDWSKITEGIRLLGRNHWLVLELAAKGLTNEEISARTHISESGVKEHISEILQSVSIKKPAGAGSSQAVRAILTQIWLKRDRLEHFEEGAGI